MTQEKNTNTRIIPSIIPGEKLLWLLSCARVPFPKPHRIALDSHNSFALNSWYGEHIGIWNGFLVIYTFLTPSVMTSFH